MSKYIEEVSLFNLMPHTVLAPLTDYLNINLITWFNNYADYPKYALKNSYDLDTLKYPLPTLWSHFVWFIVNIFTKIPVGLPLLNFWSPPFCTKYCQSSSIILDSSLWMKFVKVRRKFYWLAVFFCLWCCPRKFSRLCRPFVVVLVGFRWVWTKLLNLYLMLYVWSISISDLSCHSVVTKLERRLIPVQ